MVTTLNGLSGLTAVGLAEEVHRQEQGHVPIRHQRMVEKTVVNWDQLAKHKNVTQTPAVSCKKLGFFFFKSLTPDRHRHTARKNYS